MWINKASKSKKPLIIGGIILAVAAFVGLIVLVVTSSNNGAQVESPVASFNRYANYLLFGEEKDETPAGEFDLDTTYEIDRQLGGESIDEKYWGTAKTLLDSAVTQYRDAENPTNPDMSAILDSYLETFNFVYLYRQSNDFAEDNIVNIYNNSGSVAAENEVKNFYARYSDTESQTAKKYAEQRISQYDAMIKLYNIYDSLGCIQNGEIRETSCSSTPDTSVAEEIVTSNTAIIEANARANQILEQAIRSLKDGCWRIGVQLQETPEEIPVEEDADEEEE